MTPSERVERIREKIFMWLDFYNSSEMTEASDMENELVKIVVDLISQAKEEGKHE